MEDRAGGSGEARPPRVSAQTLRSLETSCTSLCTGYFLLHTLAYSPSRSRSRCAPVCSLLNHRIGVQELLFFDELSLAACFFLPTVRASITGWWTSSASSILRVGIRCHTKHVQPEAVGNVSRCQIQGEHVLLPIEGQEFGLEANERPGRCSGIVNGRIVSCRCVSLILACCIVMSSLAPSQVSRGSAASSRTTRTSSVRSRRSNQRWQAFWMISTVYKFAE